MANANDIDSYHHSLRAALDAENLLGQRATVRAALGTDWKNPKFVGPIDFDLWPIERPMTAVSDHGGESAVFAFEKLTPLGTGNLVEIKDDRRNGVCWISWHERWDRLAPDGPFPGKKRKQPHFMLGTMQWILFWGPPDEDRKVQIVCAEWDNAAHVAKKRLEYDLATEKDSRLSEAGQPHWHVDRVLELGDVDAYLDFRGTDLEEEAHSSYAGQYLKLQRVHLAMGGWRNGAGLAGASLNHAARWQIDYTENRDELIDWNLATLRYIKSQVPYITGC